MRPFALKPKYRYIVSNNETRCIYGGATKEFTKLHDAMEWLMENCKIGTIEKVSGDGQSLSIHTSVVLLRMH